jgi:hypothetical protein
MSHDKGVFVLAIPEWSDFKDLFTSLGNALK